MWLIKRVYMDGAGHEEAFYKDLNLNYIGLAQASELPDDAVRRAPAKNTKAVVSTYQQLVNGGGKSTYIALLLSVFEPSVNDFTQYLANRRKSQYHYKNYFYRELSVILVEMVNEDGQTLLLGHAHQRNGNEVERLFFICDAPDSLLDAPFDEVPSYSRAERSRELRPYANTLHSFESWLNQKAGGDGGMHWRKTRVNKEWREFLVEQQINVDLIKTMVTFNSEEGGLTKFIDYKTEQDFLGAFFACSMSKDTTEQLRELVTHEVHRQGELEAIRRNESFLGDVLSNWRKFLEPAHKLEAAEAQQQEMAEGFREAMRDLTAFAESTQAEHTRLKEQSERLQEEADQATSDRVLHRKRKVLLEHDLAQHQLNEQQRNVDKLNDEADSHQCHLEIAHAAIDYKTYATAKDRYRQSVNDLQVFQSETEKPLQVIFDRAAGEALGVLRRAISGHQKKKSEVTGQLAALETQIQTLRESIGDLRAKLGGLNAESKQCRKDRRKGELRRDSLREDGLIQGDETPASAQHRLASLLQDAAQHKAQTKIDADKAEQVLEAHYSVVSQAEVARSQAQNTLTQVEQKHQEGVDSAQALTSNYHTLPTLTQRALDLEDANWHSAQCGLRIDEVLETDTQTLQVSRQRLLAAQHERDELKQTGHEMVTKQIKKALEGFYAAGIAREKLWAFPRYLASAFNDDAERIAGVIDQNPGRYLSLVALDDATFAQVSELSDTLPWKGVPIAIHRLDEAKDLLGGSPDSVQAVLSNPDKYGYSQAAYEARLQELEQAVVSQETLVEEAERDLMMLEAFKGDWRLHNDQYGKHWSNLVNQLDQARSALAEMVEKLEQAKQHEQKLRDAKGQAQALFESAQQQHQQAQKFHDTLDDFVVTEWAARNTAIEKLAKLNEQKQRCEDTLETQSDELKQTEQAAESDRSEATRLSFQIDQWASLSNQALYSGVLATEGGADRNPQDAHDAAVQAQKQLLEAAQGDKVTELKHQREKAEQAQNDAHDQLSTHSAYRTHLGDVQAAASSALALINDRITQFERQQQECSKRQITAQATLQNIRQKCEETREALVEGFVWTEKPTEVETIKTTLSDTNAALREAKERINHLAERQKLLSKDIEAVKEQLHKADNAQAMIQSYTPTPAAGLPVKILDIAEYVDALRTESQRYAQLEKTLKVQETQVGIVWGHYRNRIMEESAKNPDDRASQEYLHRLESIATWREVLGDLERVDTGIAEVYEAVKDSLEQFQRSIKLTVKQLTSHLDRAIKLLKRAKSVRIPDNCPVLPGRAILKMTDRLNDLPADLESFASARLQHWIAKGQVARSPNRDVLTADLVQSVLSEGDLDVRMLKTNASRPKWTHITQLEGSGGQLLTSAFLLFVTVGKVREYDTGISGAGFLLADNPLGKSNADDLLRIQTQMARAYNIQLIYLTGISDENAQSMFDNHLFLNKTQKLKRRDLVTIDNSRQALWAASLAAKPQPEPVL